MKPYKVTPLGRAALLPMQTQKRKDFFWSRYWMYQPCHSRRHFFKGSCGEVVITLKLYPDKVDLELDFDMDGKTVSYTVTTEHKDYDTVRRGIYHSTSNFLPSMYLLSNLLMFLLENEVRHSLKGGTLNDLPF